MKILSPYPGLRPFEMDENDIFFGRDEHIEQLIDKLDTTHFIAVLGPSGCGKSSLVRAGLEPNLRKGYLTKAGIHWRVAVCRPGNHPFYNLA
jgi:ABC-type Fe3+/spermidine/putrescine transport system ATPase subunit